MSDQQRLLLAAVLMSLVLMAGWMLGSRRTAAVNVDAPADAQEAPSVTPEEGTGDIANAESTADSTAVSESVSMDAPTVPERRICVRIPAGSGSEDDLLVEATILTLGGGIDSWVMPGWRDLSEEGDSSIDLAEAPWFVASGDGNGGPVAFESDSPDTVTAGEATTVVLRTGTRTRTYTFHAGSYSFEIEDDGAESFTVSQGAIPVTESRPDMSRYFSAAWFAEKHRSKKSSSLEESLPLGRVLWVASRSRYFTVMLLAEEGGRVDGYAFSSEGTNSPAITLSCSAARVYAGPVDYDRLHALGSRTDTMVDFGWPLIRWIGKLIHLFMTRILAPVSNWGVRIVILSAVMKFAMMPLSIHSTRSMKKMQAMQPLVLELQKKYANDPMRQREELSKLYKTHGVNPAGGCLPLLLQMPIFFALYRVLENSVALRGAGFVLWITDLSKPEILLPFGTSILGITGIGLLPLLMGAAMYFQQKSTITDPAQKSMATIMPIMMTWFFMRFPAGLSLYWFVNNIIGIVEQRLLLRRQPAAVAVETTRHRR